MKHNTLIRMMSLLLCLFTLLGTVACGNAPDETVTTAGGNVSETEGETEYKPDIAVKDYDCDFNIVIGGTFSRDTIAIEDMEDIKAGDPMAKVVMCSAMGQEAMVVEAIKLGALDFIVKPFKADRILQTVKKVLG